MENFRPERRPSKWKLSRPGFWSNWNLAPYSPVVITLIFFGASWIFFPGEISASENIKFPLKHKIELNPIEYLPGKVSLEAPRTIDLSFVRALLVIDEKLFAVPMILDARKKWFTASFPSPSRSISYQIQLIDSDGRSLISPITEVDNVCEGELEAILTQHDDQYDDHSTLVADAITSREKVSKLEFAIRSLENINKRARQ